MQAKTFIGWSLAATIGFTLVYCTYSENKEDGVTWSREFRAVYESVGRPLWAACVAWVIAACHYGRGGKLLEVSESQHLKMQIVFKFQADFLNKYSNFITNSGSTKCTRMY